MSMPFISNCIKSSILGIQVRDLALATQKFIFLKNLIDDLRIELGIIMYTRAISFMQMSTSICQLLGIVKIP